MPAASAYLLVERVAREFLLHDRMVRHSVLEVLLILSLNSAFRWAICWIAGLASTSGKFISGVAGPAASGLEPGCESP